MATFKELFEEHLNLINSKMLLSSMEIQKRALVHDQDKIFNPKVNNVYEQYFDDLKKIPFGTEEYKKFEQEHFKEAHLIHSQNRHHFYSRYNDMEDVNLFDLLEAAIDISESARQYGGFDKYQDSFEAKGLYDLDLKSLIDNTIDYLNKKDHLK